MKYKKVRAKPKLKKILVERNIMQKTVAIDLMITQRGLSLIMQRKAGSNTIAYEICSYLGVEFNDIFERVI